MKIYFLSLLILIAGIARAEKVTTQLKAQVTYVNLEGKHKKFLPIRLFVHHDTDGNILNQNELEDCQFDIGKKDLLSLFTEPNSAPCLGTAKNVYVEKITLAQIFADATALSFKAGEHFDRINSMYTNGNVDNVTNLNNTSRLLRRFVTTILGDVEVISLLQSSQVEITDDRGAEKYILNITPKKVIR